MSITSAGNEFERFIELKELEVDTNYKVLRYRKVHGSCGLHFFIQVKKAGTEELSLVIVRDGNLHYYLKNPPSKYKFQIRHDSSETGETHINVNSNSNWIELENKPAARPFAENDLRESSRESN